MVLTVGLNNPLLELHLNTILVQLVRTSFWKNITENFDSFIVEQHPYETVYLAFLDVDISRSSLSHLFDK